LTNQHNPFLTFWGSSGEARSEAGQKSVEPYWVSTERLRARDLDAIYLQAPSPLDFADVVLTARRLVSQVDRGSDGVSLITPDSLIQGVKKLQKTIGLSVGSVALLSLV